jgi:hypothetical protein
MRDETRNVMLNAVKHLSCDAWIVMLNAVKHLSCVCLTQDITIL